MKKFINDSTVFLCILKKNGKISSLEMEKTTCLAASAVVELLMEDVLAFDGKKLSVQALLPEEKSYLRQVYDVVAKKQPVKFENVIEYFSFNITDNISMDWWKILENLWQSWAAFGRKKAAL